MFERLLPAASLALLAALTLTPAPAAAAGPLYERAFMLEADRRCALFTPGVRAALETAAAQARGAARRAGEAPASVEHRARERARATACAAPDLKLAAGRVRAAHAGWAKVQRLTFPGRAAEWRADRTAYPALRWRLVQTRPAAVFGLAGARGGALRPYAVARFRKAERPALVRLTVGRRVFLAESNAPAPEALALDRPEGFRPPPAWAFRFPSAAVAALDAAGPADLIRLDFIGSGRGRAAALTVPIERGDYAAARAFAG